MLPKPATVPVSTPRKPKVVDLPPGLVRVTAADRIAMCEPADQDWVSRCIAQSPPAIQPSTRPADLLLNLRSKRDVLQSQMTRQLDLPDPQAAAHFLDDTLTPLIARIDQLHVRAIYLVVTKPDLKRLVIGGWGGDQFHFNRIADKVAFNGNLSTADESVVPAIYAQSDSSDARTSALRENIEQTEAGVATMISREAQAAVQLSFANFILDTGMRPLKLKLDQEWLAAGLTGELSSQYIALISGANPQNIIRAIARPDSENPNSVPMSSIDLLHPIPADQLRPEMAGAYADAFRRRSVAVVSFWLDRAGPDAIPKTLTALRATPPPDGPALLDLIKKTSAVDLSNDLGSQ